jgi:SAM-dependent methyltransferase
MIEFTGERVVPGQVDANLWAEHVSRYALAAEYLSHLNPGPETLVLDIGCGAGYGTARLATTGSQTFGLDVAPDAAAAARHQYGASHTSFFAASATALPFPGNTFDLITAYEVIEHIDNWNSLLSEAARVLKTSGIFFVSTPNIEYYTESRGDAGPNPFHVHEFEYQEFCEALTRHFPHAAVLLQDRTEGFVFRSVNRTDEVHSVLESSFGQPEEANFFLGVCSHSPLPPFADFLFIPRIGNLLRERERHVTAVNQQLAETRAQFAAMHQAHEQQSAYLKKQNQWAQTLDRDLGNARQTITSLNADLEERTRWAHNLDKELTEAREIIAHYQRETHRLQAALDDYRTHWDLLRLSRWIKIGRKLGVGPVLDPTPGQVE